MFNNILKAAAVGVVGVVAGLPAAAVAVAGAVVAKYAMGAPAEKIDPAIAAIKAAIAGAIPKTLVGVSFFVEKSIGALNPE